MRKAKYLSQRVWRALDAPLRRAILRVMRTRFNLSLRDIVSTTYFVSTLEAKLRECGEHEIANMLITKEEE